jgi:hypothetical protein
MKGKSIWTSFVLFAMIAIASCSKQDQPLLQSNRPYPPHPMAGKEIQFDSLAWQDEDFIKNVFISIDNRPDILLYSAGEEVFLRLDTSSVWKSVNTSGGFTYSINAGRFFIAPSPADTSLSGRSASIKIKFK